MKVLVFGCGPAGLLAAHAASFAGSEVTIVSVKQKSPLYGCQYLHGPIPGLQTETETVHYRLEGTSEDYRAKQYGGMYLPAPPSPAALGDNHPAWDIRSAYDQLWDLYQGSILDYQVQAGDVRTIVDHYGAGLVVSSVPAPVFCQRPQEHSFASVQSWAMGDAPQLGQTVPVPCPEFTVLCNGTKDVSYYRVSNVFGYKTAEWPGHLRKPPIEGVVGFHKPVSTNCDCNPDIMRVGRYGTFTKGVLSHEAFNDTVTWLLEKGRAQA